jgi:hypothetical protein
MRIRLVRCSGRRGTTHAIPLKALSCTRRRLTSSGRPNDGFLDSASPPTIFDQLSQVERRCADARGRDGGVREELKGVALRQPREDRSARRSDVLG